MSYWKCSSYPKTQRNERKLILILDDYDWIMSLNYLILRQFESVTADTFACNWCYFQVSMPRILASFQQISSSNDCFLVLHCLMSFEFHPVTSAKHAGLWLIGLIGSHTEYIGSSNRMALSSEPGDTNNRQKKNNFCSDGVVHLPLAYWVHWELVGYHEIDSLCSTQYHHG